MIYLVRHGDAASHADDAQRPLSARGRDEVDSVARWVARNGLQTSRIRHSGKKRAEETAAILSTHTGAASSAVSGLAPNDDVHAIAIEDGDMLVGHMPFMSRLASLLVTGDADRPIVEFATATIVCLARREGEWVIVAVIAPALAR